MPVRVRCGEEAFDALPAAAAEWLEAGALCIALGGTPPVGGGVARGYRATRAPVVSLRDHARALETAVFLHGDAASALDVFLHAPLPDGSLWTHYAPLDSNVSPPAGAHVFDDELRGLRFWRDPLCADAEALAVCGALRVFRATGDKRWLQNHRPVLQRALQHLWEHPRRWSGELDLPKRPFTLDSFPVAFQDTSTQKSAHYPSPTQYRFSVHPGDASQLFAACNALAEIHNFLNDNDSDNWQQRAQHIEAQLNSVGWNGQFYTHQIHLSPGRVRGVDEARQLAACNAFAINAGVAQHEQCAAILKEYQRRRELYLESQFCEWWSIHPPYPETAFGIAPGQNANGGAWPQIGGELALAAFHHGFESYGVDILRRFYDLAVKPRRAVAWYAPDGTPARDEYSAPHDVVGASAMLRALVEGVCGVRDEGCAFGKITLSPRWPATGQTSAEVEISYAPQPAYVSYRWALDGGRMTLDWDCKARGVKFQILLPRGNTPERVALGGRTHEYSLVSIEKSKYVVLETEKKRGTVAVTLK
jgi:hypothetical protein